MSKNIEVLEKINESLREDISEIVYNNVSPNVKLCETVESLEKMSSSLSKPIYDNILSNLQSVFMTDLESALKITNIRNVDAIEYENWVLAADSFMLNKYDVIAKSLEVRSHIQKEKDVALYNYITVNMGDNIKPLIEKLTIADITDARKKIVGLEMLLSDNFLSNARKGTDGYSDNLDYAKKCVNKIKDEEIKKVFQNGISEIERINSVMNSNVIEPLKRKIKY